MKISSFALGSNAAKTLVSFCIRVTRRISQPHYTAGPRSLVHSSSCIKRPDECRALPSAHTNILCIYPQPSRAMCLQSRLFLRLWMPIQATSSIWIDGEVLVDSNPERLSLHRNCYYAIVRRTRRTDAWRLKHGPRPSARREWNLHLAVWSDLIFHCLLKETKSKSVKRSRKSQVSSAIIQHRGTQDGFLWKSSLASLAPERHFSSVPFLFLLVFILRAFQLLMSSSIAPHPSLPICYLWKFCVFTWR